MTTSKPATEQLVAAALAPLKGVSEELYERTVTYVMDGSGPEVLQELRDDPDRVADDVLVFPCRRSSAATNRVSPATWDRIVAAGLGKGITEYQRKRYLWDLRRPLYRSGDLDSPLMPRFGRVLHAVAQGGATGPGGAPAWLRSLLADMMFTSGVTEYSGPPYAEVVPEWTWQRVAAWIDENAPGSGPGALAALGEFDPDYEKKVWL